MSLLSDLSEALIMASLRSLNTDIMLHDIGEGSKNDIGKGANIYILKSAFCNGVFISGKKA